MGATFPSRFGGAFDARYTGPWPPSDCPNVNVQGGAVRRRPGALHPVALACATRGRERVLLLALALAPQPSFEIIERDTCYVHSRQGWQSPPLTAIQDFFPTLGLGSWQNPTGTNPTNPEACNAQVNPQENRPIPWSVRTTSASRRGVLLLMLGTVESRHA